MSRYELPDLTQEEIRAIISTEKKRRALLLRTSPDQITITKETFDPLVILAREAKYTRSLENDYWRKVDLPRDVIRYSPELMKQAFLDRASKMIGRPYVIDDHNREIIDKLSLYFAGSQDAEKHGLSLKKGLLLMGDRGTGKTVIMKAFANNPQQSYRLSSVRFISYDFVESGFQVIKSFSVPESIATNAYGQNLTGYCFDDLGTDEERRRFGDKVNAMGEILLNRYDSVPHHMTHITTNLNPNAIEQFYGSRLRSRFREMFNQVAFDTTAPDRRK